MAMRLMLPVTDSSGRMASLPQDPCTATRCLPTEGAASSVATAAIRNVGSERDRAMSLLRAQAMATHTILEDVAAEMEQLAIETTQASVEAQSTLQVVRTRLQAAQQVTSPDADAVRDAEQTLERIKATAQAVIDAGKADPTLEAATPIFAELAHARVVIARAKQQPDEAETLLHGLSLIEREATMFAETAQMQQQQAKLSALYEKSALKLDSVQTFLLEIEKERILKQDGLRHYSSARGGGDG